MPAKKVGEKKKKKQEKEKRRAGNPPAAAAAAGGGATPLAFDDGSSRKFILNKGPGDLSHFLQVLRKTRPKSGIPPAAAPAEDAPVANRALMNLKEGMQVELSGSFLKTLEDEGRPVSAASASCATVVALDPLNDGRRGQLITCRVGDGSFKYFTASYDVAAPAESGRAAAIRMSSGNTPLFVCQHSELVICTALGSIPDEKEPAPTGLITEECDGPGEPPLSQEDPDFHVPETFARSVTGQRTAFAVWLWASGTEMLHMLNPGKAPPREGRYGSVSTDLHQESMWPRLLPLCDDRKVTAVLRLGLALLFSASGLDLRQPSYIRRACVSSTEHADAAVRFAGHFVLFHLGDLGEHTVIGQRLEATETRMTHIGKAVANASTPLQEARARMERGCTHVQLKEWREAKADLGAAIQVAQQHPEIMPMLTNCHLLLANALESYRADEGHTWVKGRTDVHYEGGTGLPPGIEPGLLARTHGLASDPAMNNLKGTVVRAQDGRVVVDLPIYGEKALRRENVTLLGVESGTPQARELVRLYLERTTPCHANYAAACYDRSFQTVLLRAGMMCHTMGTDDDSPCVAFDAANLDADVLTESFMWYRRGVASEMLLRQWNTNPSVGQKSRARSVLREAGFTLPHCDKVCAALDCSRPGKHRCRNCKGPYYCSKDCQVRDWRMGHRDVCKQTRQRLDECNEHSGRSEMWKMQYENDDGEKTVVGPRPCAARPVDNDDEAGVPSREEMEARGELIRHRLTGDVKWSPLTRTFGSDDAVIMHSNPTDPNVSIEFSTLHAGAPAAAATKPRDVITDADADCDAGG